MAAIDYDPRRNAHTLLGAEAALQILLSGKALDSVLDIGCGPGAWLAAAKKMGTKEIIGIDGLDMRQDQLFVPKSKIIVRNLESAFDLGRCFELVICLETAEHLPETSAELLVRSVTLHGNTVLFSAACPNQNGQHHVNCQWPSYWQALFNRFGFRCDDTARWAIWSDSRIEPWYRQNIFWARSDRSAGHEPRLLSVIHPEMLPYITWGHSKHAWLKHTIAAFQYRHTKI